MGGVEGEYNEKYAVRKPVAAGGYATNIYLVLVSLWLRKKIGGTRYRQGHHRCSRRKAPWKFAFSWALRR